MQPWKKSFRIWHKRNPYEVSGLKVFFWVVTTFIVVMVGACIVDPNRKVPLQDQYRHED